MATDFSRIATLKSLSSNGPGGRAILDVPPAIHDAVEADYKMRLRALAQNSFWLEGHEDYRPSTGLRLPQRRAVAFAQAYLATRAHPDQVATSEAALIKMPTGTGKTGVIAALACASAGPCKTLILTPRKALVRQMAMDLATRFWRKLGAAYTDNGLEEGLDEAVLVELDQKLRGKANPIRTLVADQYGQIWAQRHSDRQIWVGTFNALHRILGVEPPAHRDFYGREAQAAAASLSGLEGDDIGNPTEDFRNLLRSVDLVIVDEGHHEPAFSWAQAVRALNKPTIVFSATPYRNDYKYFQLSGRFVFNLPWDESVQKELIRNVAIEPPLAPREAASATATPYDAKAFVREFRETLQSLPAGKKAIVHAATFQSLKAIQRELFTELSEHAVLIHDRVLASEKDNPSDLLKRSVRMRAALQPLRFAEVYLAAADDNAKLARIWLHQSKLLEGIDDPSFVEIWLYDSFGTARQLIQQIGRAIRRPDLKDQTGSLAVVRGSSRATDVYEGAPTVAAVTAARWQAYLEYERYAETFSATAFTAETQLLPILKRFSPAVQYVAGEFRGAHWLDQVPTMEAFILPRRGTVCRVVGVSLGSLAEISDSFLDQLQDKAVEAMQLEERFDIAVVQRPIDAIDYKDVRMVRYLVWRNSPILKAHQIPEWTLGVMAIVRAGPYIFLLDTEGNCLDHSRAGLAAPEPIELKRLFARSANGAPSQVRIVETTARGLDVSELGLRSLTVRRHALDSGYFDLAEASQTPTSVEGYSPLGDRTSRRRLSLARSSVADAVNKFIPVKDYADWAARLAAIMSDKNVKPHGYFDRFAREVPPLDKESGAPRSILLDVVDLVPEPGSLQDNGWDRPALERMLEADTCLEIQDEVDDNDQVVGHSFIFDGHKVLIDYVYRNTIPAYGRYQLRSDELNAAVTEGPVADDDADDVVASLETRAFGRRLSPSLTRLINGEQAFQIITSSDGVVYSHGHFYKPDLDETMLNVLEGDAAVAAAISEKGDTRLKSRADWSSKTLFGLVETWARGGSFRSDSLAADVAACDTIICDDSTTETADFYGIDPSSRKVLIIHAKADDVKKPTASARKLQEVARQALTSLALTGSARQTFSYPQSWKDRWSVTLNDAGRAKVELQRLWKSPDGDIVAAHRRLRVALADPLYSTDIIVLCSGLLGKEAAKNAFANKELSDLQFLYYLATVRSTFDRAGVRLRIVCNP